MYMGVQARKPNQKGLALRNSKGFTLIEIVLVLAIAGLIFVIVFLAVQGAQRGRRDTERKSAAGRLLAAATQVSSNLRGDLPGDCGEIGTAYNDQDGRYPCTDGSYTDKFIKYSPDKKCDTDPAASPVNATGRATVQIALETGAPTAVYCLDDD